MREYLYAFDLSMSCTGMVIFDITNIDKGEFEVVDISSVKTKPKQTHPQRLKTIADHIKPFVKEYKPTEIAIEKGFSRFNKETQALFKVRGMIDYLFNKYPQQEFAPSTVKKDVAFSGKATKEKLLNVITSKYPDITFKNMDESDAFAVGVAWMIKNRKLEWNRF